MYLIRSIALILIVAVKVFAACRSCNFVVNSFWNSGIVPYVIPKAPTNLARVKYLNADAKLGNRLSVVDVAIQPKVTWKAESNKNYTLAMVDPDAPSRAAPILSQILHWLVVNIPGNDVAKGVAVAPYLPPTPPPKSGPHRYIFLVYKECSPDSQRNLQTAIPSRVRFSIAAFARRNNLGDPVAGNFYFSQLP